MSTRRNGPKRARCTRTSICLGAALSVVAAVAPAAGGSGAAAQDFSPPPPPERLEHFLAGELHLGTFSPVRRGAICPETTGCIFSGGGGIGGFLEWRYPRGLSVGLGYEGLFLDGKGVYELTVIQVLRATVGFRWLLDRRSHPFVGAGLGPLILGDSFHYATMGVALDLSAGVELEVSHSLATRFGLGLWADMNGPFTSKNDAVRRSQGADVNLAITLQIGLVILQER